MVVKDSACMPESESAFTDTKAHSVAENITCVRGKCHGGKHHGGEHHDCESIADQLRKLAAEIFNVPENQVALDVPLGRYADSLLVLLRFVQRVEQEFAGNTQLSKAVKLEDIQAMSASLSVGMRNESALSAKSEQQIPPAILPEPSGWVSVPSGEKGDGKPLVLCFPYAGGKPSMFQAVAQYISRHCDVQIARYAQHVEGRDVQSITSIAEELVDALLAGAAMGATGTGYERHIDRPVVLLGHCYGAYLAHAVAREMLRRGLCVQGLIVAGATPPDAQELVYASSQWSKCSEDDATLEYLKSIYAPLLTEMTATEQEQYWKEYKQAVRRMERYDFGEELLTAPCLVVTGESEEYPFVVEFVSSWKRCFSRCHFAHTPGGHLFVQTHGNEFAQAAWRFVNRITGEGACSRES